MASQYARDTTVDPSASRGEIERTLMRYGATGFGYATEDDGTTSRAAVSFIAHGRQIRMLVTMPSRTDRQFTHTPSRDTPRTKEAALKGWEKAVRQRWRALALLVKALLESVESDIVTFEQAFLPYTVVPGTGMTVAEQVGPALETAIEAGTPARLQLTSG